MKLRYKFITVCVLILYVLAMPMECFAAFEMEDELCEYHTADDPSLWEYSEYSVLDSDELKAIIQEVFTEHQLSNTKFNITYCFAGTGETWSYNGDKIFKAMSWYKLPLCMAIASDVATGKLNQNDKVMGMQIDYIEERALVYSDNKVSMSAVGYLTKQGGLAKKALELAGLSSDDTNDLNFIYTNDNLYSSNFMMRILKELYTNQEQYPKIIYYMKQANRNEWYDSYNSGKYDVAQKYGGESQILNVAGIIYTPIPYLVTAMSENATEYNQLYRDLGKVLTEYTLTLTERLEEKIQSEATPTPESATPTPIATATPEVATPAPTDSSFLQAIKNALNFFQRIFL